MLAFVYLTLTLRLRNLLLLLLANVANCVTYATEEKNSILIHPGTKWCGVGTLATNYSALGNAFEADRCCRKHDLCQDVIQAKTTKHHYTSIFHFTISNCECDVEFYHCLTGAGDSQGRSLVDWFFKFVQVPCFELVEKPVCQRWRPVSLFLPKSECVEYANESVAELRRLPFFSDELGRMLKDKGSLAFS